MVLIGEQGEHRLSSERPVPSIAVSGNFLKAPVSLLNESPVCRRRLRGPARGVVFAELPCTSWFNS